TAYRLPNTELLKVLIWYAIVNPQMAVPMPCSGAVGHGYCIQGSSSSRKVSPGPDSDYYLIRILLHNLQLAITALHKTLQLAGLQSFILKRQSKQWPRIVWG